MMQINYLSRARHTANTQYMAAVIFILTVSIVERTRIAASGSAGYKSQLCTSVLEQALSPL